MDSLSDIMDKVSYIPNVPKNHFKEIVHNIKDSKKENVVNLIAKLSLDSENIILVHSLYKDVLDAVQCSLNENHISSTRLTTNFNDDWVKNEWKILLFNYQLAEGLDLTRANHLIMIEPTRSPIIESKVTSRIIRFTQKRNTTIHWILKGNTDIEIFNKCQESKVGIKEVKNILKSTANDF